ncbi:MAG TPA: PAS domain S-box protein [Acidimicrobiales bacterium]|nr:PAS domain S-box protein [Acidimicrobiales bacterium]
MSTPLTRLPGPSGLLPDVPDTSAAGTGPGGEERPELSRFLDLSAQIMCIVDVDGLVVWGNPAFERALGYHHGELAGVHLDDLVHPEDAPVRTTMETALAATGEHGPVQIRFRARDGRWRWLEWTTRADERRGRLYGVARDVTDRRLDEAALSDSEARLQAIMQYSPSVVYLKDLDGNYFLVNEEFCRATGVARERAVGSGASTCWPQDAETIARNDASFVRGAIPAVTNERLHTVDGLRDFMVSRFLLRGDDGTPYGIGGIASDVTSRVGAERALQARDRLLDSVIKASPDMITLMDRKGKIHQISEAESIMFGYPHEVFNETGLFEFVHPDDFDDVASMFVRMVTGAVSHLHLRYRVHHADGHWVTVDSRARSVLDAKGHFAGAVVVSRDISDKLESEQRLQASRDAAEQASRAKSDFLSRMSHELRTPLNSILGFAQLLQMDELPGPSADAVEHILRAGHHLLDLIDEVLDIARIESGHLELAMSPVSVAEVVAEAVELTSPIATRAEVTIRALSESFVGQVVVADRQRVMQVLLNLLSNAVKYNHPGGSVEVTCATSAPGRLRLAVADTGRGIRPEDLDRVFVPFDRIDAEQTGVEGTGVGLALSQHLCERMGGRLGVESVPDVGSTFFVDLAAGDPAVLASAPLAAWADGATAVPDAVVATDDLGLFVSPPRAPGGASEAASDGGATPSARGGDARPPSPRALAPPTAPSETARPAASRSGDSVRAAHAGADGAAASSASRDATDAGDGEAVPPGLWQQSGRLPVTGHRSGGSFRVLLVEDNLTTLDLVERVLSRRPGTEVLAAMQGGLGVELAREHRPDLVLLDIALPDMAGSAVLDRLAEDPSTAGIPVAVVAADAPAHQVRQLLGRGIVGFLDKPIDVRGLLSIVDAVRAARG